MSITQGVAGDITKVESVDYSKHCYTENMGLPKQNIYTHPPVISSVSKEDIWLFLHFECGHEYYFSRGMGDGSGWDCCLCSNCQPYHGILNVGHPCALCNGSFSYLRNGAQKITEIEAKEKLKYACPFYGNSREDKLEFFISLQ
jgi:hypothetical protein